MAQVRAVLFAARRDTCTGDAIVTCYGDGIVWREHYDVDNLSVRDRARVARHALAIAAILMAGAPAVIEDIPQIFPLPVSVLDVIRDKVAGWEAAEALAERKAALAAEKRKKRRGKRV